MAESAAQAPGQPGLPPRWTSSAKSGVGTARNTVSHVWFTLSHGILNEVYYPHVDRACIRDMGLVVTDGAGFFSEEKRDAASHVSYPVPGVPAYHLSNVCHEGRYRIEKEIITDPRREVVLQRTRFIALKGTLADYHLYVLLAPHLGNCGWGNSAFLGNYKGTPLLLAHRDHLALSLACSVPWLKRSAGFVGSSDGWQDLNQHGHMEWTYERAENGNVALTGEIDLLGGAVAGVQESEFLLALGLGHNTVSASHRALASLHDGFDVSWDGYVEGWQAWQEPLLALEKTEPGPRELYRISTAVLRMHEAKHFPGGTIASLSIPWGQAKGDEDLGGYHLVWPRDMVETAGGLLAAGAWEDARHALHYLQITQESDGRWPQNLWLDGTPYWSGIQMDETALPIVLIDLAESEGALRPHDLTRLWPMVRRAAGYLVRNGPVTQQDRWEEDPGYSPFTLAAEIAALLVAAELADRNREPALASYLRETADAWNAHIEEWTYVTGTDLAAQVGVEGYYVRVGPVDEEGVDAPLRTYVPVRNRPAAEGLMRADHLVSPDALALVRFGLRSPDDPRIVNTVRVLDALLKVETPFGPAWHRYNSDGYGEHADGSPFDGTGVGRPWPLLTGERAHYELAAGRPEEAVRLMRAMEAFASDGGLIPEQVWDAADVSERELYFGRPTGSAMPLVWAHAEYIKLRRSLREGRVFDMPQVTVDRYRMRRQGSTLASWRFNHKVRKLPTGKTLRLELPQPAQVQWSADGWQTVERTPTRDTGLGIHLVDLPTRPLAAGTTLVFTFYWQQPGCWQGEDFTVVVV